LRNTDVGDVGTLVLAEFSSPAYRLATDVFFFRNFKIVTHVCTQKTEAHNEDHITAKEKINKLSQVIAGG